MAKTIHDWPPELLTLMFRLGSEDVLYNPMHKSRQERCLMPKRIPEDRHYVIKLFARVASEVCSNWRTLILPDRDLRLVIIGTPGSINGRRSDTGSLNGWKRILEEVASYDVQLYAAGLYGPYLGDVLVFIGDNAARLTSLQLNIIGGKDFCAGKLFNSTTIKFPRLQHLDIILELHSECERQALALDTSTFPSLKHLVINAPFSSCRSFSSNYQTINSLRTFDLRLSYSPLMRYCPESFMDVLRTNPRLQVLSLDESYHIYPEETRVRDPTCVIELGSVVKLNLLLTMNGTCQFLAMCSFPVLKALTLSVSTAKLEEPLKSTHLLSFPALETLVLRPNNNDVTKLLSYFQVPRLASFTYDNFGIEPCTPFSLIAPYLREIQLSGTATSINSFLRFLQQPRPPGITSATIRVGGDYRGPTLMDNIDPSLFSNVGKLRLDCFQTDSSAAYGGIYSHMVNLQELELLEPIVHRANRLLPTIAEAKHLFLPKLESVKCYSKRPSYHGYSRVPPLLYEDCLKLIALAEGQAKRGQRLKLICLEQPLDPQTRSRLENVVDKVVAPERK